MPAAQTGITLRVVSNKLTTLPPELRAAVAAEVKVTTLDVEAAAKQKAPVRTGTLRRSIHSLMSANGMSGTVGPSVHYGIYVEFGTRHRGATPYMRPAAELVYPRFVDRVAAVLRGLR